MQQLKLPFNMKNIIFILCSIVIIYKGVNYFQYKKQMYLESTCEEFNIYNNDNKSNLLEYDLIASAFVISKYAIADNNTMQSLKRKLKVLYDTDNIQIEIKDYIGNYKLLCVKGIKKSNN